ncbi:MAG: DUF721 domain-containing protein [Holophagales bacterium]|jgi:hypothetical protein|nr:DUF721 domain-containing protein [Holophagales bacterium]
MTVRTKKWGGKGELRRLAEMEAGGVEAMKLDRLKRAWPLFVGQANALKTRPLSIRQEMLVIGCHDSSLLADLRASGNVIWPDLRDKVNAALKVHLQKLEIVPCDPEPDRAPPAKAKASPDPLEAVLRFYQRANANKNGQSGPN